MAAAYWGGRLMWTPADDAALRRRYPYESTATLARDLGRTVRAVYARAKAMGLAKTEAYLASPDACRLRRDGDVHPGRATQFKKGQAPANKGLRRPGWAAGRMKETQFRKGERRGVAARVYKPIGTERLSKDGYLERKVHDGLPLQARWRAVHLVLWEAANGPVPAGHAVSFINGDRRDVRLENLRLIPRTELMRRNTVHNYPPEVAQTIQLLGALNRQIRRKNRVHDTAPEHP